MPSSRHSKTRFSAVLAVLAGALSLRASVGCGTQPCFRHSDCASNEICSAGNCVLASVDLSPLVDGGPSEDAPGVDAPGMMEGGSGGDDTGNPGTSDAAVD